MATSNRSRKRKKVYCSKCTHLLLMQGLVATCVATAHYESDPLQDKVAVHGLVSVQKRNKNNNCKYYRRLFSWKSFLKKRVVAKLLHEQSGSKRLTLKQYESYIKGQSNEQKSENAE